MYTAQSIYGATPQAPSWGVAAPTERMGTDDLQPGLRALIDPHNPLVWLGGIIAITVGLASVAGSVRVGKATLKGSLGKG